MQWLSTAFTVIEALALIAGVVLAVVTWRRQPRTALLAALGLGALFVAYAAWLLEVVVFPSLGPGQVAAVAVTASAVAAVFRVAGLVLLMFALISRARGEKPRAGRMPL
ncbi:MAG TPA: hypothetical protein VGL93_34960 [Streptosporangiaceae bacterium]|jgi:hypothetical protein